ncbi:Piso0_005208 [Millerozyma farinosa CBS 7064]|uniref:Piso0_005208 protein n=1 Tax=Pichia sorbitophila (strain ATCC MYA-4447 / BCRC 22081 / CBS 7064 / NBRC 10061 / NRRL Y-12695) TaxID=559304 RepID=G8Y4H8_PICSO|nr:Piso0_005208 [Millerozyma farinosa CBS 7064]
MIRSRYINLQARHIRSMGSTIRPKILRIGKVYFAHEEWEELSKLADVVECTSKNREEFFRDLKEKYSDVTNITRTFPSTEQTGRFDEELIKHLPSTVKTVSHCGAGYDQVDPEPLTQRNIQLSNVTKPVEAPTADTAVYLILATLRNFQIGHDNAVKGLWPTTRFAGAPLGREPSSSKVGIIGMGGIGRAIRDRLAPFGFKEILYYNRSRLPADLEKDSRYVSFDDILAESDIICISVPLNRNTWHLIDNKAISKMKEGAILINTARGAIIHEQELLENLKSGKLRAFGSDVFEFEPEVSPELLNLPNVVSLPHMGTYTSDSLRNMEGFVVENVITYLNTGKLKSIVPEQMSHSFEGHHPLLSKS